MHDCFYQGLERCLGPVNIEVLLQFRFACGGDFSSLVAIKVTWMSTHLAFVGRHVLLKQLESSEGFGLFLEDPLCAKHIPPKNAATHAILETRIGARETSMGWLANKKLSSRISLAMQTG